MAEVDVSATMRTIYRCDICEQPVYGKYIPCLCQANVPEPGIVFTVEVGTMTVWHVFMWPDDPAWAITYARLIAAAADGVDLTEFGLVA